MQFLVQMHVFLLNSCTILTRCNDFETHRNAYFFPAAFDCLSRFPDLSGASGGRRTGALIMRSQFLTNVAGIFQDLEMRSAFIIVSTFEGVKIKNIFA